MSNELPSLRVAAVQLSPEVGNVDANLEKSRDLIREALAAGARCVVLPEFFTTGMAFDDVMLDGHRPLDGEPMQLLVEQAKEGGAMVGGSFLAEYKGHVRNTFVLACDDGQVFTHDKDFPSGPVESAYYAGGEDAEFVSLLKESGVAVDGDCIPNREHNATDGVFELPNINVGAALCWETIRNRTVARALGRIDLLIAGSAWPDIDPDVGFAGMSRNEIIAFNAYLAETLENAPKHLAQMLGVPVIQANLVGPQRSTKLFDQPMEYVFRMLGESKIVNSEGKTVAHRRGAEGEGVLIADLELEKATPTGPTNDFWIPDVHPVLKELWYNQGAAGRQYYLHMTCPHRDKK
jgi:predicted amidohydrolase